MLFRQSFCSFQTMLRGFCSKPAAPLSPGLVSTAAPGTQIVYTWKTRNRKKKLVSKAPPIVRGMQLPPVAGFSVPIDEIRKTCNYAVPTKFGDKPGIPKTPGPLLQSLIRSDFASGYDKDDSKFLIRRQWWIPSQRVSYWANWPMLKDWTRRQIQQECAPMRLRIKALRENRILPKVIRDMEYQRMHSFPVVCWPRTRKDLCQFTGRRRGLVRRFRLSRIRFRYHADHAQLSGVIRAIW